MRDVAALTAALTDLTRDYPALRGVKLGSLAHDIAHALSTKRFGVAPLPPIRPVPLDNDNLRERLGVESRVRHLRPFGVVGGDRHGS